MKKTDLDYIIRTIIMHQYENGFKHVSDIDNLTDKILATFETFLDSQVDLSYNEHSKGDNDV